MTKDIKFYEDSNYILVRKGYPWNLFYSLKEKFFYSVPNQNSEGYSASIYGNKEHVIKTFKREVEVFKRNSYEEILSSLTDEGLTLLGGEVKLLEMKFLH